MKTYRHSFQVAAPITQVAAFHRRSANMAAITPPPIIPRIHSAPDELNEGEEMDFTLWMGPVPIRWLARYENVTPTSFVDRQIRGPFRTWIHEHRFESVNGTSTIVYDSLQIEFSTGLWDRLVGVGIWLGLPMLFAYRQRQTQRLLARK